ncbi:trehalase family glycosidase [Terriglobus sp.]|uniref:trehalase family glycosidase n=1 Tax=Terriglobus sp. TaxID=1889013 RepID=UPI003AFF8287
MRSVLGPFTLALTLCSGTLAQSAVSPAPQTAAQQSTTDTPSGNQPIRDYIRAAWDTLSRSQTECKSVRDPKVTTAPILYLPAGFDTPPAIQKLHTDCGVEIEHLPHPIAHLGDLHPDELKRPGLLYLPNPYVVPGGRFNEMYGWDSFFIVLGLLSNNRIDQAHGMAENFFFEINNYGAVLNANRTYYLTRSQPPLLAEMIREIHKYDKRESAKPGCREQTAGTMLCAQRVSPLAWLATAYTTAQKDYALWTSPVHQAGATGLSRYFDVGEGPVLEMADDSTYYPDAIKYLIAHPSEAQDYLVPASAGDAASCDQKLTHVCVTAEVNGMRLSRDFYKGDRADRESGYDTTFRFGAFSGSTHHIAPVCLNSLLYRYELDMAGFAKELGKPADVKLWNSRAAARKAAMQKYLWSDQQGAYVDYDFQKARQTDYTYATAFFPLWAGIATPAQARQIAAILPKLEHEHGLAMSTRNSGQQWDLPFGWAPNQWFAVLGLRRYGFVAESDRLAQKFRADVETNYMREGNIREKYDVDTGLTTTRVLFGYKANGIGFGWTNGVYLRLQPDALAALPSGTGTK